MMMMMMMTITMSMWGTKHPAPPPRVFFFFFVFLHMPGTCHHPLPTHPLLLYLKSAVLIRLRETESWFTGNICALKSKTLMVPVNSPTLHLWPTWSLTRGWWWTAQVKSFQDLLIHVGRGRGSGGSLQMLMTHRPYHFERTHLTTASDERSHDHPASQTNYSSF